MHNSKLIQLMASLDKAEVVRFLEFVTSPYFNKRKEQVVLAKYLKKYHPDFPPERFEKDTIFKLLFPVARFDLKRLRYEMSYLTKLLEDFLAIQYFQDNQFQKGYHLLESLNDKKLDKYFNQTFKKLDSQAAEEKEKNARHYLQLHLLNDLADDHFSQKRERKFDIKIQDASHFLDLFYLSQKLRYSCNMIDRQKFLAIQYKIDFQDELHSMLEKVDFEGIEDIEVYDKLFHAIDKEDEEQYFFEIVDLLKKNSDHLWKEDQKEIFMHLINYCARKIRRGNEGYVETALELYLIGIQSKVLFIEGFLSPWTFKNIISLGLRSKRYEWVKDFINEYGEAIKPQFRRDALNFNLADLSFHQNEFRETLSYLNMLNYSDIYYTLNGRVLLLKTYFHLEELNPLLSGIASFTIYLKRNNQITKDVKNSYLNFCNLLFRIVKAKPNKIEQVIERINNTEQVISKAWLNSICKSSESLKLKEQVS